MIAGILDGLAKYGRAFGLISKYKLWGYFLVPGLISLLLGTIVFGTAYNYGDNLGGIFAAWYPAHWYGSGAVESIATWVGSFLIIGIALILYKYIILILMGPFMGPLSQKVEEKMTGESYPPAQAKDNINAFFRGIRISLRMVSREVFFIICLLLLSLIPVVGIIATILSFLVQAYYAGMGNMDFTLERHYNVKGSIAFTRRNRGYAIGNGLVYLGLLFIPIIGLLLAPPLGTVASTIGAVERLEAENA